MRKKKQSIILLVSVTVLLSLVMGGVLHGQEFGEPTTPTPRPPARRRGQ